LLRQTIDITLTKYTGTLTLEGETTQNIGRINTEEQTSQLYR